MDRRYFNPVKVRMHIRTLTGGKAYLHRRVNTVKSSHRHALAHFYRANWLQPILSTVRIDASERLVRSLTLKWRKLNEWVAGLYLVRESMFRKDNYHNSWATFILLLFYLFSYLILLFYFIYLVSHISLTQWPPQGRQLIKRHNTRLPSIRCEI